MATPALRSLRLGFPRSRIFLQGKPKILDLLKGLDSFDEVLPFQDSGRKRVLSAAAALRPHRFDMGLLLPNSFSSALVFFLGGVRNRTGYALNGRGWLLNRSISISAGKRKKNPSPMTGYYLGIARFAGGDSGVSEDLELAVDGENEKKAESFLEREGLAGAHPLVGMNVGASFGPSKCWTPEGFARLADAVREDLGGRVLLLCGPGEEEIARSIVEKVRHPLVDTSLRILPLDLVKSVMRRLDILVTTDAGPRHIAVAFKIPVVVLMGPTNPAYTDSNLDKTRVVRVDVDCAPCHKKECDRDHECMKLITPAMVMENVKDLLDLGITKGERL